MTSGFCANIAAFTHVGRVRKRNEDTICVNRWVQNAPMNMPLRSEADIPPQSLLCLVADGVGGAPGGAEASVMAVTCLCQKSIESADAVPACVQDAHRRVVEAGSREPDFAGMATTIVGVAVSGPKLVWFNVGDSKLFRLRDGYADQISIDDIEVSARRSFLSQALGGSAPPSPHAGEIVLPRTSRWLLCSDGLTDMVSIEAIERCMENDIERTCRALFQAAMIGGGGDNISLLVLDINAKAA